MRSWDRFLFISLIFTFNRHDEMEKYSRRSKEIHIVLPPITTHVNISCPLSSYGPARDSIGSFCSLYITGTAGGTVEKEKKAKRKIVNHRGDNCEKSTKRKSEGFEFFKTYLRLEGSHYCSSLEKV